MLRLITAVLLVCGISCANAQFARNYVPSDEEDGNVTGNPGETPIDPYGNPITDYVGDQRPPISVTTNSDGTTSYNLKCKVPLQSATLSGPRSMGIQFKGEICPVSTNELVVMLVNDESNSMVRNDKAFLASLFGCGRYSAVKELIKYIDSVKSDSDKIYVGLVGFATSAHVKTGLIEFKKFKSYMSARKFCVYQDGNAGATNYQHAFQLAQQEIAKKGQFGLSANTPEAVFLISDGTPTSSNNVPFAETRPIVSNDMNQPQLDGLNASKIFSANATLSALYLDEKKVEPGITPIEYLGLLTNDPARVAIASNASELAGKMAQLALPGLQIVPGSVRITQTAGSSSYLFANSPADYTFSPDALRKNVYNFQTKYVNPMVLGNGTTDNLFKIQVQARHKDGRIETFTSQLNLRFTPTN